MLSVDALVNTHDGSPRWISSMDVLDGCPRWMPSFKQKLWFQHILPHLSVEFENSEVSSAALEPVLHMVTMCSLDEYQSHVFPLIQKIYRYPSSIKVGVRSKTLGSNCKSLRNDRFCSQIQRLNSEIESTNSMWIFAGCIDCSYCNA